MDTDRTQRTGDGVKSSPDALRAGARTARWRFSARRHPRRVVVWERGAAGWRVVAGEIGGARPRVLSARVVRADPESGAPVGQEGLPRSAESVLVVRSRRCVCRSFEVPVASESETRRMLSLRLETEMPHRPTELTWTFQRQGGGHQRPAPSVLLIAAPTEDLEAAERELQACGRRARVVESYEAALAQMAAVLAPGVETAAIVEIEDDGAAIAVARNGRLDYARHLTGISAGPGSASSEGDEASRLAGEIYQSLQHYLLRSGARACEKLLIVGREAHPAAVAGALAGFGQPVVAPPPAPDGLEIGAKAGEAHEVCRRFAPCVGALVALHRRARGEQGAAPPLRLPESSRRRPAVYRRAALVAANLLLAAALVAVSFGVRRAALGAAGRAVEQGGAVFQNAESLEAAGVDEQ